MKFKFTQTEKVQSTYVIDLNKQDFLDFLNGDEPTEERFLDYLESEAYWASQDSEITEAGKFQYDRTVAKEFLKSLKDE